LTEVSKKTRYVGARSFKVI